jgi:hypothetical protein
VVDEFHCIVEHGYDFRPYYLLLGLFVSSLAWVLLLFTATAPPALITSARTILQLAPSDELHEIRCPTGSLRAQMTYHLLPVSGTQQRRALLSALLAEREGSCIIVYCPSRSLCEALAAEYGSGANAVAEWQNGQGGVAFFHAHIPSDAKTCASADDERDKPLDKEGIRGAWNLGQLRVMFCTIAWGMGMDKSNVRAVIHWSLPKSVESFYQEASRAGRDGSPAESFVFYDFGSWVASAQQRAGSVSVTELGRDFGLAKSLELLAFLLESTTCRHLLIEKVLGDGSADHNCNCSAADVPASRRCITCIGRDDEPVVARCEWIPVLLQAAALLRRVALRIGSGRPPRLLQLVRAWRKQMKGRWLPWQCDRLLGLAVSEGVFTTIPVLVQRSVATDFEVGDASPNQWALSFAVHASGHRIAYQSPNLESVCMPSWFDPATAFAHLPVRAADLSPPPYWPFENELEDYLEDVLGAELDAQSLAVEASLPAMADPDEQDQAEIDSLSCDSSSSSSPDSEESQAQEHGEDHDDFDVV